MDKERAFLTLLLSLCLASCSGSPETNSLIYGPAPNFSLTERSGRTITRNDMSGKVWVADFIFTHCAGSCPSMSEKVRKLQETLPREIEFVSFTVDPQRDTPEVLNEYAKHYNADENRWLFLTGEKGALYDLSIKGFKLALDDTGGTEAEPIIHSTRFVLVDKNGQIRGYYGGLDGDELNRLAQDAKKLL